MKAPNNFELIGVSMLIMVGLVSCGNQSSTAPEASQTTVAAQENRAPVNSLSTQNPRDIALAAITQLSQRADEFARSSEPICQKASSILLSIGESAIQQMKNADNAVQQGGSGLDVYEAARSTANAGLDSAKAMDACLTVMLVKGSKPENTAAVQKDYAKEAEMYQKAAKQGNAEAQNILGNLYANGLGVPKDHSQAAKWFQKAAAQGNVEAQSNLGDLYFYGGGVSKDYVKAAKWYRKAAEQGDASAQHNLGAMYAKGQGVAKDDAQAVQWIRKAAEQGDATAQHHLGAMYAEGQGMANDDAQAVQWMRKAAEQGDASAQHNLGAMYGEGRGVAKDDAQAVQWIRKAAEQGNASAQNGLGVMYAEGRGVAKDLAKAKEWFEKSAAQEYESARKNLRIASAEIEESAKMKDPEYRLAKEAAKEQEVQQKKNTLERMIRRCMDDAESYLMSCLGDRSHMEVVRTTCAKLYSMRINVCEQQSKDVAANLGLRW